VSAGSDATQAVGGRQSGRRDLGSSLIALRGVVATIRQAVANDGIRRLGLYWSLGIAADGALTVLMLVTAFNRGGVVAAALFGAIRMLPAILFGMFAGSLLQRFRGDRVLVALGIIRAAAAGLTAYVIAFAGPTMRDHEQTLLQLFVLASIAAAASAPVRPTQITLMPAIARSTDELVAANTVWSTGEGLGAFVGPFVAGVLMGIGAHAFVGTLAALVFLVTAVIAAGLKFEQASDASGGGGSSDTRSRLLEGIRAVRSNPLLSWTMFGTFGQVVTRFLMSAVIVVAALGTLDMGQGGTGLLAAALGLGGLLGAIFAMVSRRSERLVRTEIVALVFWGAPLAVIGVLPWSPVALVAMVVIGVANATYDVALFTILQRASANELRAPVLSLLEAVIGVGAVVGSLLAPVVVALFLQRGGLITTGLILPVMAVLMWLRIGRIRHVSVVDEDKVGLLRQVPAFAELPLTGIERLSDGLVPFKAEAGIALMTQGEPGDRFLVIEDGEIEVSVDGKPVSRMGRGAGVGEIALLKRRPRTATVTAVTDVSGYGIDAPTFLAAVAGPAAAAVTERMVTGYLARSAATS
jgi:MFS family permease